MATDPRVHLHTIQQPAERHRAKTTGIQLAAHVLAGYGQLDLTPQPAGETLMKTNLGESVRAAVTAQANTCALTPIKVAILSSNARRDRDNIQHLQQHYELHFIGSPKLTSAIDRDEQDPFDMCQYVDECVHYIEQHAIDAAIATGDVYDLALAAVCTLVPRLRRCAPSVDSCVLALHKIRAREVLDPNPIRFAAVDLCKRPQTIPFYPAFLKPLTGTCSQAVALVESEEQVADALGKMRIPLERMTHYLAPFLKRFLTADEYAEAAVRLDARRTILAEEYMGNTTWLISGIGGYVYEGEIEIWSSFDNNYCRPYLFGDCTLPSQRHPEAVLEMERQFRAVVARLIARGFDYMFVNVEFFISATSHEVRMVEVNTRMLAQFGVLYRRLLSEGDLYRAQIDLSLGRRPVGALFRPGLVGSGFYLYASMEEWETPDVILDFHEIDAVLAQGVAHFLMDCESGDSRVGLTQSSSGHTLLAHVDIVSGSYAENRRLFEEIVGRVSRLPDRVLTYSSLH